MWILECDGAIFQGKRLWLRPGKKYLFGRTKPEKGKYSSEFVISHKSVSRKHMTLSVAAVKPGDAGLIDARSELILEDEKTKIGTTIDDKRISGEQIVLKNDHHIIKLGSFEHLFHIKWHPVVLTIIISSKEMKDGKDPMVPIRGRIEDLGIKAVVPYVDGRTTHVVATKRNTAKGLQALVNGQHIVNYSFLDALVYVTTPSNLDEPESLSPLEADFNTNWPSEVDHLPPPSKEPGQRAAELFKQDLRRKGVFDGYSFVFCNLEQFESLQPPIASGGGKALHFPIESGESTATDLVRFVKRAAGEDGLGEFEDGTEGKGVVVVRFRGKKGFEDWAIALQHKVALDLNLRLIEQNEFLDAILMNDASKLRRALPEEYIDDNTPSQSQNVFRNNEPQARISNDKGPSAQVSASQPRRARAPVVRRFKGFDDDDDDDDVPAPTTQQESYVSSSYPQSGRRTQQSIVSKFLMDSEAEEEESVATQAKSGKKRPPPSEDEEDAINDNLLPAAAAMKRRRLEEEKEARRNGLPGPDAQDLAKPVKAPPKKKQKKEIDIQEIVRQKREEQEAAAKRQEESLRQPLGDDEVKRMRNLAVFEEMDIPERLNRAQRLEAGLKKSDRWDERWNGRKNFKKFRRRGEQTRRGPSVIVPLEEVKKKDYGIGEEYWLEGSKKKSQDRRSRSRSAPIRTAKSQPEEDFEQVPAELTNGEDSDVIDIAAPRSNRAGRSTQIGKRKASDPISKPAPVKKQKKFLQTQTQDQSESDSEDDLKFRFKRKGRA